MMNCLTLIDCLFMEKIPPVSLLCLSLLISFSSRVFSLPKSPSIIITMRKDFDGAGDYSPSSLCVSYSKWKNQIEKIKYTKKPIRKTLPHHWKNSSHSKSIFDWFYQFFKEIFNIHHQMTISDDVDDEEFDTITSTCSSLCPLNDIDSNIRSVMKSNEINLHLNPLIINRSSIVSSLSKSTQTECDHLPLSLSISPLYCFSLNDGHLSSSSSDHRRSHLSLWNRSCHSQTKIGTSLHCIPVDSPEVIFAESTCQLIKQAWSSANQTGITEN